MNPVQIHLVEKEVGEEEEKGRRRLRLKCAGDVYPLFKQLTSEVVSHLSYNYLRKYVENCEATCIGPIIWSHRQADGSPTAALMT